MINTILITYQKKKKKNNGCNGLTVSMTGLNALSLYLSSWFAHWAVTVRRLVGVTVGMGDISLLEGLALPTLGIGLCLMWVWVFWALRRIIKN